MSNRIHPLAGKPATCIPQVDVSKLLAAYADLQPDPSVSTQRVAFGTSGHRGGSLRGSFNQAHVLAIVQAICEFRSGHNIDGPLFVGIDTHALSQPAFESTLEVLAANGVEARISMNGEYTPTPAVSHAILAHNRGRSTGLADGIVITPSHNPPDDGGIKYNPPKGGPADSKVTGWIETRANQLLETGLNRVKRVPFTQARRAASTREHDYLTHYVTDLEQVLNLDIIRSAGVRMGVDALGGAGVHYWGRIAEHYRLDLTIVSDEIDPSFRFMSLDWDGKIRMDPSSAYAMQRMIGLKDRFDIAFACDTDHDRHAIVAPGVGLLPTNHSMSVAIDYLFRGRPGWSPEAAIGKSLVSSALIDRVAKRLQRNLVEAPVGFKWFVDGLFDGSLAFAGEESAGAAFNRKDGSVWTTDKDGMVPALLSAEITASEGQNPGELYRKMIRELGEPVADRVEAAANAEQKARLSKLSAKQVTTSHLAGERIVRVLDAAPGNKAPLGGIKVITENGWFAARPSGTEDIYKIYAESFLGREHLHNLLSEAQSLVDGALAEGGQ